MGIELATAYVTIVPSLKGATKAIQAGLGDVDVSKVGTKLGKSLGRAMGKGLSTDGLKSYEQAVKTAERSVSDAMSKSADAIKQVEVAQKRLAEVRAKYGEDSSQAAQAELDLARAQRGAESAAKAVTSAQERLADAQEELAVAIDRSTAAAKSQSGALSSLGRAMTSAGDAVSSGSRRLVKLGDAVSGIGDNLVSHVTAPLVTAAAGVGAFALSTASAAETTEISFTTMLGSAEAATEMMGTLADFAAHTPFELSGLQTATRQLLAYGFTADEVVPMLTAVGDATAALGTGQQGIEAVTRALGQMQTRGKVSSEEMLQLTEQGIPAWQYLAEAIGTDTAGAMAAVSEGAVDAETGIKALTEGMERDFGGMMDAQSKTIAGLMSNLTDAIEQPLMELRNSDAYAALADSLSHLVDAAGPFVESMLPMMEDGLSAVADVVDAAADGLEEFADMSESDKESLVELAAAAAAAGPAMSVLGRGMKVVGSVGEGIGSVLSAAGKGVTSLSDKMLDLATAPETAGTALGKLAGVIGSIPAPAAALAAVVGGVAVAAMGALAAESAEAAAHQQLMADVTMDASDIMAEATGSASGLGDAIGGIEADVDGTLGSMQKLNQSVSDTLADVEVDGLKLDQYVSTIQELGNQSGLSATEQYRLQQAVEGYNEVVGTQYSVIDAANGKIADQNGVIQENTDQLNENAGAWKNRARAEAYQSVAAEYMEEEVKASHELSVAQANLNDAYDERARLSAIVNDETKRGTQEQTDAAVALDRLNREIPDMEQGVSDLSGAYESAARNGEDFTSMASLQESLYGTLGDRTDAFMQSLLESGVSMSDFASLTDEQMQQLAQSWDGSTESIITGLNNLGQASMVNGAQLSNVLSGFSEGEVANALTMVGIDLDNFSLAMANAGISAEQLNAIGSANFTALAANCGGNIDQLIGMLSIYNSAPIYDKNGNITADTTQLVDALGNVYTWNGTTLTTKSGAAVVDASSLQLANDQVLEWNEQGLPTINGTAMAQYQTVQLANGEMLTWNGTQLVDQQGNVYVEQQELVDALGNTVEWNGTTLNPIEGDVYCTYDELTAALGSIDALRRQDGYTATVYLNTVQTTTQRTVYESSGGGEGSQSLSVMPLSAPMAAPANAGISLLADAPAPVYAAGDDGIAHPVALASSRTASFTVDSLLPMAQADLGDIDAQAKAMRKWADAVEEAGKAAEEAGGDAGKLGPALDDIAQGLEDAAKQRSNVEALNSMLERAGVTFNDAFIAEIVSGSGVYSDAVGELAGLTDEELQRVVDTFAESKVAKSVTDLAMALMGDAGLKTAFYETGQELNGFASDMNAFGLTVDDITGKVSSFADSVSNGFQAISWYDADTSLYEYASNLKHNIRQSKYWAEVVEKTFSKVADYAPSEAFRKAVLEGGMQEWGRVIEEMSRKSREEIIEVIDLYNEAAQQGMNAGMSVVGSLIPDQQVFIDTGGDIASGIAQGIEDGSGEVSAAMLSMCEQAAQTAKDYFGIHSPSRLMRKLFGYVGDGAAEGIVQSGRSAVEAMRDVCRGVAGAVGSVSYAPASWAMGGGAAPSINQTINFNQPVQSPYQMAQAVRRERVYGLAGARG